jgi:hypothetical protein
VHRVKEIDPIARLDEVTNVKEHLPLHRMRSAYAQPFHVDSLLQTQQPFHFVDEHPEVGPRHSKLIRQKPTKLAELNNLPELDINFLRARPEFHNLPIIRLPPLPGGDLNMDHLGQQGHFSLRQRVVYRAVERMINYHPPIFGEVVRFIERLRPFTIPGIIEHLYRPHGPMARLYAEQQGQMRNARQDLYMTFVNGHEVAMNDYHMFARGNRQVHAAVIRQISEGIIGRLRAAGRHAPGDCYFAYLTLPHYVGELQDLPRLVRQCKNMLMHCAEYNEELMDIDQDERKNPMDMDNREHPDVHNNEHMDVDFHLLDEERQAFRALLAFGFVPEGEMRQQRMVQARQLMLDIQRRLPNVPVAGDVRDVQIFCMTLLFAENRIMLQQVNNLIPQVFGDLSDEWTQVFIAHWVLEWPQNQLVPIIGRDTYRQWADIAQQLANAQGGMDVEAVEPTVDLDAMHDDQHAVVNVHDHDPNELPMDVEEPEVLKDSEVLVDQEAPMEVKEVADPLEQWAGVPRHQLIQNAQTVNALAVSATPEQQEAFATVLHAIVGERSMRVHFPALYALYQNVVEREQKMQELEEKTEFVQDEVIGKTHPIENSLIENDRKRPKPQMSDQSYIEDASQEAAILGAMEEKKEEPVDEKGSSVMSWFAYVFNRGGQPQLDQTAKVRYPSIFELPMNVESTMQNTLTAWNDAKVFFPATLNMQGVMRNLSTLCDSSMSNFESFTKENARHIVFIVTEGHVMYCHNLNTLLPYIREQLKRSYRRLQQQEGSHPRNAASGYYDPKMKVWVSMESVRDALGDFELYENSFVKMCRIRKGVYEENYILEPILPNYEILKEMGHVLQHRMK